MAYLRYLAIFAVGFAIGWGMWSIIKQAPAYDGVSAKCIKMLTARNRELAACLGNTLDFTPCRFSPYLPSENNDGAVVYVDDTDDKDIAICCRNIRGQWWEYECP